MRPPRPALLAGLVLSLAACGGARDARPSLVVVTLDTTRADALSALGGRPGTTEPVTVN